MILRLDRDVPVLALNDSIEDYRSTVDRLQQYIASDRR